VLNLSTTIRHLILTIRVGEKSPEQLCAARPNPEHTCNHRQGSNISVDIDSSSVWFGALTPSVSIAERTNCRFTYLVMDAIDLTDRAILESQHFETLVIAQEVIMRSAARLGFALHLSSSSKQPDIRFHCYKGAKQSKNRQPNACPSCYRLIRQAKVTY
jgi:hypothetical protein